MKNLKLLVKLSYDFMKKLKNLILFLIILTNFSCIKIDTKIVCDLFKWKIKRDKLNQ